MTTLSSTPYSIDIVAGAVDPAWSDCNVGQGVDFYFDKYG